MCSLGQGAGAVEPCIKHGLEATATTRELGHPGRARPVGWHRERKDDGGALRRRDPGRHPEEQRRAAADRCLGHGRRSAHARREPGCPGGAQVCLIAS